MRELLRITGLHPRVFLDRLLSLGEARVDELLAIKPAQQAISDGIRAAV